MTISIDNSKIFLNGIYGDTTVVVAANTTLKAGTLLGVDTLKDSETNGQIIPFDTAKCTAPSYVLAQDVQNSSESNAELLLRVFECGEVNKNKLVFVNSADSLTPKMLAELKSSGILAVEVHEETKTDVL